ncbi:MAG: DNA polymerase/3'-5' exonuclease PolX [Candidatus Hydrogenedentes bacterium]|nr:DNA polymerase/3'-5' exonuclease PolX [Candidatus Hydrogenedentota bacterium]
MTNEQIADMLREIADILDIKGENPFKIRAYRRAVDAVKGLSEEVGKLYAENRLLEIEGIGKGIAGHIDDLFRTGHMSFYEEARSSIPVGLLDILNVPGLGPKKVRLIWDKLGISTLDELEDAARHERLRALPGLGAKSETSILAGIGIVRQGLERTTLGAATRLADEIVDALSGVPGIERVVPAGSLRRGRETIGDIDILVVASDAELVMDRFVSMDVAAETIARGPTKSSIRIKRGIQVDLRVVAAESFGAALVYFTGSKQHNVHLRSLARKHNLKVSEYGVFDGDGRNVAAGPAETDVYAALDMEFVPPEMREDTGEIEAALDHRVPRLIETADLRGEIHAHSTYSDGRNTIAEMAQAAADRGYEYIVITDHSKSLTVAHGLDAGRLADQADEIERVNASMNGFRVFRGIEVDIMPDGSLDLDDDTLAALDFVVASVHSRFRQSQDDMTRRICAAIENPHVDAIGHPTGRLINRRPPYELDIEQVMAAALRTKTALELNAHYSRLDLRDVHLRRARELGVMITIATDAHVTHDLDMVRYGIATARRGWLEPQHVLNTRPLDEFMEWLNR